MENVFKTLVAIGGGVLSVEGKLKSKIGLIGIARKVFIFAMVAVAHLLDTALGDQHVFRNATIFFYLANEVLSIIENAGRIALPVPEVIKKAVDVLKEKGRVK
ncbi:holin [Brevibacillus laterosporus]|uniref:Holin n=1 Tax=Brevibacillus laterosporus TaxID=1465 RepID=A0A518VF83_BRELA|nr:holin [Brevibacillus laterosporus]